MLPCQNLCRCHHCRLIAILYCPIRRKHCHRRFAAADIPLHQTVHDFARGHVLLDFRKNALLRICQGKGKKRFAILQGFFLFQPNPFPPLLKRVFQLIECRLQQKQLLKNQTPSGIIKALLRFRKMDIFYRKIAFRQMIFLSQPEGQLLLHAAAHFLQGLLHQIAEHFLRKPLYGRINRKDAPPCEILPNPLTFRGNHLCSAIFFLQPAGKKIPFADFQTAFHVGLIIPQHPNRACFVVDLHSGIHKPAVAAVLPLLLYLRQKGSRFIRRQVCNFQYFASVLVFSGVMRQQILHCHNAQPMQPFFSLLANALEHGNRILSSHEIHLPSFFRKDFYKETGRFHLRISPFCFVIFIQ